LGIVGEALECFLRNSNHVKDGKDAHDLKSLIPTCKFFYKIK
jgi:hypothetical protein